MHKLLSTIKNMQKKLLLVSITPCMIFMQKNCSLQPSVRPNRTDEKAEHSEHYISNYFAVNQSIGSECSHILHMCQVSGNRLVVCGQESGQYRLTLYDLQDEDLCSTTLKDEPGGLSRIKLGGKHCIAVSYP